MMEGPIDEKTFKLACALYSEKGGADKPVMGCSISRQQGGKRYAVIRNAAGQGLAIYRVDFDYIGYGSTWSVAEPEWPEPSYSCEPRDHIYALGAISANYSHLESALRLLFLLYTRLPHQTGLNLFAKLNNELRINIIRDALVESDHPTEIQDGVECFLRAFMTIFNARNILMHAAPMGQATYPSITDPLEIPITLEKVSTKSPSGPQIYEPSLDSLRKIADSAHAFRVYGSVLYGYVMWHYEKNQLEKFLAGFSETLRPTVLGMFQDQGRALPDRPPQPTPLIPHSLEDPKEQQPPPQSSWG